MNDIVRQLKGGNLGDIDLISQDKVAWEQSKCPWNEEEGVERHVCAVRYMVGMCLCMSLYNTSFIQFLPPCIPFVLSDHMLGMNVMPIYSNYAVHWIIMILSFVVVLSLGYNAIYTETDSK
jgi:hypothetical protein